MGYWGLAPRWSGLAYAKPDIFFALKFTNNTNNQKKYKKNC